MTLEHTSKASADPLAEAAARKDIPYLLAFAKSAVTTGRYQQRLLREAQRRVAELESTLAERDEQLAGLLYGTDADFDEKAVPA